MSRESIQIRRPMALITLVVAIAIGAMAGSLITVKTGKSPFGAARVVPVFASVDRSELGKEVNFQDGFVPVVKQDLPAVVSISSSKVVKVPGGAPFFNDPLFRQFFGNQFSAPRQEREHSLGSGVIVSPEGYILTNNHMVDQATDIKVTLSDKREFKAHVVGKDPQTDLAVLKVAATGLPVLPFGDSAKMQPGDFVLAIGNPFGLSETVTMGIISATGRRSLGIEGPGGYEDFLQTDAAINPGNSGGALVDVDGNLIGVNTAILSGDTGGNQGIGFAIPINMARQVMDQILKNGKVVRGYLGVMIQEVTPAVAKAFGLKQPQGALVGDVTSDSPAAKAGLQRGDVILQVNGKPVVDVSQLRLEIAMMKPGTTVQLKVFRNGTERDIPVTLGELPSKGEGSSGGGPSASDALQGVTVVPLTPQIANDLQVPPGTTGVVVDRVSQSSPAADAGLQHGDVIQEVNHRPVKSVSDFRNAVSQAGKGPVLLLVNRGGNTLYIAIEAQQ